MNEEILARFERRSREKREQNFRVHTNNIVTVLVNVKSFLLRTRLRIFETSSETKNLPQRFTITYLLRHAIKARY